MKPKPELTRHNQQINQGLSAAHLAHYSGRYVSIEIKCMTKSNHQGKVLKDHKKVGKKLIPPMMQLPNLKETSFIDNTLPCLVWISALFLRNSDKDAVHNLVEFLRECKDVLGDDKSPPLAFLNNFDKLTENQKKKIIQDLGGDYKAAFLRDSLTHQNQLLHEYPLSFIFTEAPDELEHNQALEMLKEDVSALLDRYSIHSTKVQTTAIVSMAATGKLFFSSKIDLPDFNAIFTDPESEESRRVASFVRANINAGAGFQDTEGGENSWAKLFWKQAFDLEPCS